MKTLNQTIEELKLTIENANSATVEGRGIIARTCKELYNLIEEPIHNIGSGWMLTGMYNDLCSGNFSEPFMAEQKKHTFFINAKIAQDRI